MQGLTNDFYTLLHDVLTQLPSLFVMAVCIVVAIARRKQHPRVSLIVILALTYLILHTLVFAAVFIWVPRWFMSPGNDDSARSVYTVIGAIFNALFALALGGLLLAIFVQRPLVSRS